MKKRELRISRALILDVLVRGFGMDRLVTGIPDDAVVVGARYVTGGAPRLVLDIETEEGIDGEPLQVWIHRNMGLLNCTSIGFLPLEWEDRHTPLLMAIRGVGSCGGLGRGLSTYPLADDENDKRLHEACLDLEQRGLIHRAKDEADYVLWMPLETTNETRLDRSHSRALGG